MTPPAADEILYDAADLFAAVREDHDVGDFGPAPKKTAPTSPEAAGGRNNYLTHIAGKLRTSGYVDEGLETALLGANAGLEQPLDESEVREIARHVSKYTREKTYNLTDAGNGERFAETSAGDLRYVPQVDKWYSWSGKLWEEDRKGGKAMQRAINVARGIYADAEKTKDDDIAKRLKSWARESEDVRQLEAMIKIARSLDGLRCPITAFDADPWALNTPGGILDLRAGTIRAHDPQSLCSKMTNGSYDPEARSEVFDRYLADATEGDEEMAGFLARAMGYSLTGDVGAQSLFMVIGAAGSGKTTLIELLNHLLGDYATVVRPETLLTKKNDEGPRNDLAAINGRRLVAVSEIEKGKTFASAVVKSLAGSDTICARYLYGEPFTFKPVCKIWLSANDAPAVSVNDDGMWRRIIRIPFNNVIPEAKRDPTLPGKLASPECMSAIMAWAVRGCLDWQARGGGQRGLALPAKIREAIAEYRQEVNPLNDFLFECCEAVEGVETSQKDLRDAYQAWCRANMGRPMAPLPFVMNMKGRGFVYNSDSRTFAGVRLRQCNNSPNHTF